MSKSVLPDPVKMTTVHWLICIIASIGFAFDIYELLMLPLIGKAAIGELVPGITQSTAYFWRMMLFFVPAVAGGLFGLMGGYLTDRLGRRRVLTWSIILYAFSAFLAGFSTNIYILLFFRCLIFIGVCVEFVAAVAWLAELFPNPTQRERVLGYTQAFSSIGGILAAIIYGLILTYKDSFPLLQIPEPLQGVLGKIVRQDAEWRYMLMSGLLPAIPLLVIRPFLPESPAWQSKRQQGTLKRPSFAQIFSPELSKVTIVATIMVACSYGIAFGAIQQIQEIVPWFPQVQKMVAANQAASEEVKKAKADEAAAAASTGSRNDPDAGAPKAPEGKPASPSTALTPLQKAMRTVKMETEYAYSSEVTKVQEVGGLVGRFVFSIVALWFASRRNLLRFFAIPGLIITPLVFWYASVDNPSLFTINLPLLHMENWDISLFHVGIFLVALCTVAQFSYWGNYLPLVYPVHLRGTGESFAMNIGGRLLGTACSGLTLFTASQITPAGGGADAGPKAIAMVAAVVALALYLLLNLMTFVLPEPKEEEIER